MIDILCPSAAHAAGISRLAWRITRPETVGGYDATQYLAEWTVAAEGARLHVNPEWVLPIHPRTAEQMADPLDTDGSQSEMAALLLPMVKEPASLARIGAALAAGGTLRMGDLLDELDGARLAAPE
jgi:hypothetical protein